MPLRTTSPKIICPLPLSIKRVEGCRPLFSGHGLPQSASVNAVLPGRDRIELMFRCAGQGARWVNGGRADRRRDRLAQGPHVAGCPAVATGALAVGDPLAAFARFRARLADELGADPAPETTKLQPYRPIVVLLAATRRRTGA